MQTFAKTLIGTAAAGLVALSGASSALARDYEGSRYDRDHRDYRGSHGRYDRHRRGISGRHAVQRCIAAATGTANRHSYGRRAQVTGIRDVDHRRYGYKVEGRIAVRAIGHAGRDVHRWNRGSWRYDSGRFICKVDYRGRIADLDFRGIRGL
ncbi:MAG: hypothetical protein P8Y58_05065 [Novosphingobium sp.]